MFKEIQKDRIRQSNRVWAKEEDVAKEVLHDLEVIEKKITKAMKEKLEKYQIWLWLQQIKGINITTAAGLVAFVDKIGIENIKQVSSLWHYFGVHVEDGIAARARRGAAMSYNPDAKTLVLGIIADNFIRQRTPLYREIYDTEKERQLNKIYQPGELAAKWHGYKESDVHVSRGHAHNRAKRKMVKVFLSHLWEVWRRMEGLPVREPYAIEYLGHTTYTEPPFMLEELK